MDNLIALVNIMDGKAKNKNGELIHWAKPSFWGKERDYVIEALDSTWISGGAFVDRLEHEFATYCDIDFALSASNGTTAIHMAYLALGLGPGDEVVIPGFGFMAAANIALHLGATPIFAEVEPNTWCMTAKDVEQCLSPRTKAIVPIHTYGNICPMQEIMGLAKERRLAVVEDAAEAFPSRYQGRIAGTFGTIGCFSFQATKTITTGEGGMVVTADKDLYDQMALYRSHGMLRKVYYWHELPGHNFRLTNLQAALGCAQLENLERIIVERRRVHDHYKRHLANAPGLAMQQFARDVDPVLWAMAVKLNPKAYPQGRDKVMQQLRVENIETRPGFYAASLLGLYPCRPLPICEEISRQIISLPTFPALRNDQIELICDKLKRLRN
jgi:perosamine synthetase